MSYILDALKKSEQARGDRKIRNLIGEPFEVAVIPSSQPPKSSLRWPYIVVFALLLNAGFFVFWLHSWQSGGNANVSGSRISGGQSQETRRQEATVIAPAPLTQLQVQQEATESRPGEKKDSAPNPPAHDAVTPISSGPPVSGTQTHEAVEGQITENKIPLEDKEAMKTEPARSDQAPSAQPPPAAPGVSRKDEVAVKKPDGSKPPQNPKTAGAKKGFNTADLEAAGKNKDLPVEPPPRPAAGSGIISDIQPLANLGESSGKLAALQIPKWHDLAPQIRAALPNLSVSMLIYSKKPEDRWININGFKKRQGEEISAGLILEEITAEGAIFSYQGHRFYKGVVGD
jgi:general secretion pathway protein B